MVITQEKRGERKNFLRTIFAGVARILNRAPHRHPLHSWAKARREIAAKKSNHRLQRTARIVLFEIERFMGAVAEAER